MARDKNTQEHPQRINDQIRISPVRLVGANGEQLGIVPTSQAMELAREANLDLVEVAPQEKPPVCKILDFGKFRYQQSRKQTKSKVHQAKLKEVRLRPKTDTHDIETIVNRARKFLEHKDKVKVNVMFRGREMQHREEGQKVMDAILQQLEDVGKIEREPIMEGRRLVAMLIPKN